MVQGKVEHAENEAQETAPRLPLYAHASGQWAKKIRGKVHYFGRWSDHQAALEGYLRQKDSDFRRGRSQNGDGLSVKQLANSFFKSKKLLLESGDIGQRQFQDYYETCKRVLKVFGLCTPVSSLRPVDFEELRSDFARTYGPVTLFNDIIAYAIAVQMR